ncbi:DNA polymerase epsilon subunit D [Penicillium rolfsii]|nr:DNA polymerase epsilon subunit D [Penicillium rolfsii]
MPPRKSTSSVTPAETDEPSQLSPQVQSTADKPITATEQQIKARAELGVSVDDYLIPRSLTIRLAKAVLPPNTTIQKDAVLAIQKAATVFISYLSSHANDATLKRTIAPADVFNALSELEFDSFRPRLEQELEAYTEIKAGKRKTKKADANGNAGEGDSTAAAGGAGRDEDEDEDVEMADNPAKRVKLDGNAVGAAGQVDGDETQEDEGEEDEEAEDEEEDGESEEDEDEDDDGRKGDEDVDRVEDLDAVPRQMDPDADETDDDDGPASQLRDDLGLG